MDEAALFVFGSIALRCGGLRVQRQRLGDDAVHDVLQIEQRPFPVLKIAVAAGAPAKDRPGDGPGEEFVEEILVIPIHVHAVLHRHAVDVATHDVDEVRVEEALEALAAHRVVGAVDDVPVFADVVHHELDGFPVVQHQVKLLDDLHGLLLQHPLEQRVDVLKVIIEAVAIQAAVLHDLVDRDLGQRLFVHQLLQRRSQRPLRFLRGACAFHGIENPPVFYNLHHYIRAEPACQYDSAAPAVGQFRAFVKNWAKRGGLSISSEERTR